MKNEPEVKPTPNVRPSPGVSADSLKVSYSVIVNTGNGQNAFKVEGGFDLPSALHVAVRYQAEEDFEIYLTRSIVKTANVMMGQFMRAVSDAEHNDDNLQNQVEAAHPKFKAPLSQPEFQPEPLASILKMIPKDPKEPKLPEIPTHADGPLVAA